MKKNLLMRFHSIRTSIIAAFSVLIVFALLTYLLISLKYTEDTILKNSQEYTAQLIGQVNNDIDSYMNYMENISYIASSNYDVRDYLFTENLSDERAQELRDRITTVFRTVVDTRGDITNIALLPEDRAPVINDGEAELNPYIRVSGLSWYQAALELDGQAAISSSHVQNAVRDKYDWVVTLSRSITNKANPGVCGVFFVDLNYNSIRELCERISLGNKGYIYILDKDGNIVYHPQQQLIYSGMKHELISEVMDSTASSFLTEDGKLYTISRSEATGWIVVGVSNVAELMADADAARLIYVVMALVLFLVALALAYLLSSAITRPIKGLERSMKEVERGNFSNAALEVRDGNEIGSLTRSFNIMTEEIQNLMHQTEREQRAKRKYELKALQSQISPHFLYNTLDSIIWMAEGKKNEEVVLMTASLARLLRQSISNEDEVVPIINEVEYAKSYLTIQKMRYKDKLEFQIDVDSSILYIPLIKLVLQPVIENAIYHGLKYKESKGLLIVKGFMKDGNAVLQVIDDGVGMDEETLAHIYDKHKVNYHSNGVGVYNVQKRLKLYYGDDYGITYESKKGEGTTATITIPGSQEAI